MADYRDNNNATADFSFRKCLTQDLNANLPEEALNDNFSCLLNILKLIFLSPGFRLILLYRLSHFFCFNFGYLGKLLYFIILYLERQFFNCEISARAVLGGGVIFPHAQGILIGPNVRIGINTWIFQNVTIGGGVSNKSGMPKVGNNCHIYTGAVIVGPVTIGDNCSIGANVVVSKSIPNNSFVKPQPPQILPLAIKLYDEN
ncbi:MAG: hypothetical protein KBC84_05810 [Proteobacteria bacterium]|nr:hypothetical protein [Pseudomonadota bacterium]